MNTEVSTPAPVAPVVTDAPAIQPMAAPAAVAAPSLAAPAATQAGAEIKLTSDQFKQRLSEAQTAAEKKLLAKYGVEKPEDIDAKLKKLAEIEAAQLSEKERSEKLVAELTKRAGRAESLEGALITAVQEQFDALPKAAQEAIEALAGAVAAALATLAPKLDLSSDDKPKAPAKTDDKGKPAPGGPTK